MGSVLSIHEVTEDQEAMLGPCWDPLPAPRADSPTGMAFRNKELEHQALPLEAHLGAEADRCIESCLDVNRRNGPGGCTPCPAPAAGKRTLPGASL